MDIWQRLQAWYSKNGISTNQFYNDCSTEMYRDNMMTDFTVRMLDKEDRPSVLVNPIWNDCRDCGANNWDVRINCRVCRNCRKTHGM